MRRRQGAGPRYRDPEENRPARPIRDHGSHAGPRSETGCPRWLSGTVAIFSRAAFEPSRTSRRANIRPNSAWLGRERRPRQVGLRHPFDVPNECGADQSKNRQPASGPAAFRSHGILPANTRRKPRSTTLTIRNSVRLSSSKGVSSRTTSKWQSSCRPTARLPACQRGCSPNRLHNTEYANPQRFHLHFCSLCVSKSMRS
jgi:hypothetical protein